MSGAPGSDPSPAPESLRRLQQHFGESIAVPFEIDDDGEFEVRVDRYADDVVVLMVPRGDCSGADRLATYNQQYWFRLFSVMQQEYPLLCRLLGYTEFNRMVSAYLTRYPSRSPTLRDLSLELLPFLAEEGPWGRPLIRQCAELELYYIEVFDAAQQTPLDPRRLTADEANQLLTTPLVLQPHLRLFHEQWNLIALRRRCRQAQRAESVSAGESGAPEVPGEVLAPEEAEQRWALFRLAGATVAEPLEPAAFLLLRALRGGAPFATAVETIAAQLDAEEATVYRDQIGNWFQRWVSLGWFVAPGAATL